MNIFLVIALGFCMVITLAAFVGAITWRVVYYVFGCRKDPVQRWVLLTIVCLWIICGGILSLLP